MEDAVLSPDGLEKALNRHQNGCCLQNSARFFAFSNCLWREFRQGFKRLDAVAIK